MNTFNRNRCVNHIAAFFSNGICNPRPQKICKFATATKPIGYKNITVSFISSANGNKNLIHPWQRKDSHASGVNELALLYVFSPGNTTNWITAQKHQIGNKNSTRPCMHHRLTYQISFITVQQHQVSNFYCCFRMLGEASIKNRQIYQMPNTYSARKNP